MNEPTIEREKESPTGGDAGKTSSGVRDLISETLRGLNETSKRLQQQAKEIEAQRILIYMGFVVVIMMLAGLVSDIWRSREDTYSSLIEAVTNQNAEIEQLTSKFDYFLYFQNRENLSHYRKEGGLGDAPGVSK